jgi:hypothetical protein
MTEQTSPTPRPVEPEHRDPISRGILLLVLLVVLLVAVVIAAAFLPRWWAQRLGNQVDGSMSTGIALGLFYGFAFSVLPFAVLRWTFRRRRRLKVIAWGVVTAAVLAVPNLVTLAIVVGRGNAAHDGERILSVDAPGFRYATMAGFLVALGFWVAIEYLLGSRRRTRREAERLNKKLQERLRAQETIEPPPPTTPTPPA